MKKKTASAAALCFVLCALLFGCAGAPVQEFIIDPQVELDALEEQVDLYAREIDVSAIDFARVPQIQSQKHFDSLWEAAMERRVNRMIFVTEVKALTLPEGGAGLAHREGLQALTPHVWQDADGLYLVVYEITRYEGENIAYACLEGRENELTDRESALLQRARELLAQVDEGLEEYEKLVVLHDLVRDAGSYTKVDLSANRLIDETSAYGLLMQGRANCQGYADAMQLLCLLSDLPCRKIAGEVDGGEHVWNLMLVDEKWLHVDATFDDCFFGDGLPCYVYLGPSEEDLSLTHRWDEGAVPEEITGELFYYERYHLIVEEGEESLVENEPTFLYKGTQDLAKRAFSSYACREFGEYLTFSK